MKKLRVGCTKALVESRGHLTTDVLDVIDTSL